jgi:hypothetical protein
MCRVRFVAAAVEAVASLFASNHISVAPLAPATASGTTFTFPITGGRFNPSTLPGRQACGQRRCRARHRQHHADAALAGVVPGGFAVAGHAPCSATEH